MESLINLDGFSNVANNLIDKLSTAVSWVVTNETPKKVAIDTYIKDIQNSDYDPLTKAALISNAKKTIKEYSNQVQIVQKAISLLTENSDPKSLDDDWLNEFMDKARLVSDEEFQIIWARILAGEIERNNSFSIRTLDRIKSMSKKEAETFSKIATLAIGDSNRKYIIDNKQINEKHGIGLDDIITLEECGLMSAQALTLTTTVIDDKPSILECDGLYAGVIKSKDGSKIEISRSIYTFTQSGKELLNVLNVERDKDYLLDVLKMIKQKNIHNGNIEISAHKVVKIDGENIEYKTEDLLTAQNQEEVTVV